MARQNLTNNSRVLVAGSNARFGWHFGFMPRGKSGRQVMNGPMVEGPWAYTFAMPATLSGDGHGSAWEMEEEKKRGTLYSVAAGEVVELDGTNYTVTVDRRGYVELQAGA